jgi:hypothetical protein
LPDKVAGASRFALDDGDDHCSQTLLSQNGAGSVLTAQTLGIDLKDKANVSESIVPAHLPAGPRLWPRSIWSVDLRFVQLH